MYPFQRTIDGQPASWTDGLAEFDADGLSELAEDLQPLMVQDGERDLDDETQDVVKGLDADASDPD